MPHTPNTPNSPNYNASSSQPRKQIGRPRKGSTVPPGTTSVTPTATPFSQSATPSLNNVPPPSQSATPSLNNVPPPPSGGNPANREKKLVPKDEDIQEHMNRWRNKNIPKDEIIEDIAVTLESYDNKSGIILKALALYHAHRQRDDDKKISYKGDKLSVAEFAQMCGGGSSLFYNKVNAGLCYDILFRKGFTLGNVPQLLTSAQMIGSAATARKQKHVRRYREETFSGRHIPEFWTRCLAKYNDDSQPSLKELKKILDDEAPHMMPRGKELSLKQKFDALNRVFWNSSIDINEVAAEKKKVKIMSAERHKELTNIFDADHLNINDVMDGKEKVKIMPKTNFEKLKRIFQDDNINIDDVIEGKKKIKITEVTVTNETTM